MDNDKKIEFKDKYTQEEISKQTIFISIASYRDNQLPKTIQSLLDNAEYPERITIGVLHQIDYENDVDCIYKGDNKNIKQHMVDFRSALGVCWARNYIFTNILEDELFAFQIDSHIRFEENWDTTLLNMYYSANDELAVFSHYPMSYNSEDEVKDEKSYTKFTSDSFSSDNIHIIKPLSTPYEDAPEHPEQTYHVGGGYIFGNSKIFKYDVQYDPYIYFTGEEHTYALRLWTSGYNIYLPNKHILWHDYVNKNRKSSKKFSFNDDKLWVKKNDLSYKRCNHILRTKLTDDAKALENIHLYGLGIVRTIFDYQDKFGINFFTKTLEEKTNHGKFD